MEIENGKWQSVFFKFNSPFYLFTEIENRLLVQD